MTTAIAKGQRFLFLRRFLHNPREVGAVCPSTRFLGRSMLLDLDLRPGDLIVEYGPGTGALTQEIRRAIRPIDGVRYLGIESEAGFCDVLRQRMPELQFANARVEQIEQLLAERDLPRPKAIISGLPLIFLPAMEEIVSTAYQVLDHGGTFRTFSYVQSYITPGARRLRRAMRDRFDRFRIARLVARNFPPALVLQGDKSANAEAGSCAELVLSAK
ncbi:MAG: hypothetical protein KDC87_05840 [Planctomycetes bacterium]|nr:hypothetical protein [Planctomycetota bacterium]MCB9869383.1 hypothetical protein [Planctomycetota bacterium]